MKFHICIRPRLPSEQEIEQSVINQHSGVEFADNPLGLFTADTVVDQLSSSRLVFEMLVKELVDESILSDIFPVILVNGPNGSGKTHLVEGILSEPTEWGQIYQIFAYLKENEANYVKIAGFIGGYTQIYDLFEFQTTPFSNFSVMRDKTPEIMISDDAFLKLNSTDDITYFLQRARQNAKEYRREFQDLMLCKAYLMKFELEQKIGFILLMDAPLYGTCDNKMRNLLSRYIINDKSIQRNKSAYDGSSLRLQKSIRDSVDFERRSMGSSAFAEQEKKEYKSQISLRESKFFALFRDFFTEKGREEFITCLSPVETFFALERDSEWFCNCHKLVGELDRGKRLEQSARVMVEESINSSGLQQQKATLKFENNVDLTSAVEHQRKYKEEDLEPHIPLSLGSVVQKSDALGLEQLEIQAEQVSSDNIAELNTREGQLQQEEPVVSETDQLIAQIEKSLHENHEDNKEIVSTSLEEEYYTAASQPGDLASSYEEEEEEITNQDCDCFAKESIWQTYQVPEITPLALNYTNPQPLKEPEQQHHAEVITHLSESLAVAKQRNAEDQQTIDEYKSRITTLENTIFELEKEEEQMTREVHQAFQLQSYLGANTVNEKASKVNDYEIALQEQLAAKEVLIDSLKVEYRELSNENEANKETIAEMEGIASRYEAELHGNSVLQSEIDQLRADNKMAVESNENLISSLSEARTRHEAESEEMNILTSQLARCQAFESECVKLEEQTLAEESAMYEMEAEIQQLKREIEDKETTIRMLEYEKARGTSAGKYNEVEEISTK